MEAHLRVYLGAIYTKTEAEICEDSENRDKVKKSELVKVNY